MDGPSVWTILQAYDAPLAVGVGLAALLVARQNVTWPGVLVALAALVGAAVYEMRRYF